MVGELREEMTELRESVEVLSKENDALVERVIVAEGEWRKVEHGGRLVEMRKKPVSASRPGGGGGRGRVRLERGQIKKQCRVVRVY